MILIVTHTGKSISKSLLHKIINYNSIKNKYIYAMVAEYDYNKCLFSIEVRSPNPLELMQSSLQNFAVFEQLEKIVKNFFTIFVEKFLKPNDAHIFDLHLFADVNLTQVGGRCLSEQFNHLLHVLNDNFKKVFGQSENYLHVYGFSQSDAARAEAQEYFRNKNVNGMQLRVNLDGYAVSEVKTIHHNFAPFENNTEKNITEDIEVRKNMLQSPEVGFKVSANYCTLSIKQFPTTEELQNNSIYSVSNASTNVANYFVHNVEEASSRKCSDRQSFCSSSKNSRTSQLFFNSRIHPANPTLLATPPIANDENNKTDDNAKKNRYRMCNVS